MVNSLKIIKSVILFVISIISFIFCIIVPQIQDTRQLSRAYTNKDDTTIFNLTHSNKMICGKRKIWEALKLGPLYDIKMPENKNYQMFVTNVKQYTTEVKNCKQVGLIIACILFIFSFFILLIPTEPLFEFIVLLVCGLFYVFFSRDIQKLSKDAHQEYKYKRNFEQDIICGIPRTGSDRTMKTDDRINNLNHTTIYVRHMKNVIYIMGFILCFCSILAVFQNLQ